MKGTKNRKKSPEKTKHISARLEDGVYENIVAISDKLERPFNWVVNKALKNAKFEHFIENS